MRRRGPLIGPPLLVMLAIGLVASSVPADDPVGPGDGIRAAANAAEDSYRAGVEQVAGSSAAMADFRKSAEQWSRAIELGADGPAAWFNLGNALLRGGRVGEAIVAYRRAQRLSPSSEDIAANLAEARRRVSRPIEADANDLSFSTVASWWDLVPASIRIAMAISGWLVFWAVLFVRTGVDRAARGAESEARSAGWKALLAGSLALSLVSTATLALDASLSNWSPVGVVVVDDASLRSGNGAGFETVTVEPLAEGVEFVIEETRPGWWRIRLPDRTVGWISMADAESVDPSLGRGS